MAKARRLAIQDRLQSDLLSRSDVTKLLAFFCEATRTTVVMAPSRPVQAESLTGFPGGLPDDSTESLPAKFCLVPFCFGPRHDRGRARQGGHRAGTAQRGRVTRVAQLSYGSRDGGRNGHFESRAQGVSDRRCFSDEESVGQGRHDAGRLSGFLHDRSARL